MNPDRVQVRLAEIHYAAVSVAECVTEINDAPAGQPEQWRECGWAIKIPRPPAEAKRLAKAHARGEGHEVMVTKLERTRLEP